MRGALSEPNTPGNHNFMRISRILNCLNACGFDHLALAFLISIYQALFVTAPELRCCRHGIREGLDERDMVGAGSPWHTETRQATMRTSDKITDRASRNINKTLGAAAPPD